MEVYAPPDFVPREMAAHAPQHRVRIAALPTRVHRLRGVGGPAAALFVKRDDETGSPTTSGNKVRKLEFLLADALSRGCDCVLTVGGTGSNHCRAVAAAARELGLEPFLLLRWSTGSEDALSSVRCSLAGNLLVDRMVGAKVRIFTPAQRDAAGGYDAMLSAWAEELSQAGRRPYVIPMGGSNSTGSWGYVECAAEIAQQAAAVGGVDDVVVAAGSGGTLAGLGVGVRLAMGPSVAVHGVCVCDDADYFYSQCDVILRGMGAPWSNSRDLVHVIEGYVGEGYALSTEAELRQQAEVAQASGVIFDPVYSGKALRAVLAEPCFTGHRVLLIHTGGLLGCFDKVDQLACILSPMDLLDQH